MPDTDSGLTPERDRELTQRLNAANSAAEVQQVLADFEDEERRYQMAVEEHRLGQLDHRELQRRIAAADDADGLSDVLDEAGLLVEGD